MSSFSPFLLRWNRALLASQGSFCALFLAAGALLTGTAPSSATLIASDDFTYADGILASSSNDGGTGWSGPWTGNKRPRIQSSENLTITSKGYDASQHGTGLVASRDDHSGVSSRLLATPLAGTASGTDVWFSMLVKVEKNQLQSGRVGFHFNVPDTGSIATRLGSATGFILANTDFRTYVAEGPNTGNPSGHDLDLDAVHLIIGRISLRDSGASEISFWFDPLDVTSVEALGGAAYSYFADFGGHITSVGVETYSGAKEGGAGMCDALRIGSDLASVVAAPAP